MNIKKSSIQMLLLVFGVSVILYIFDVPIVPSSSTLIPTLALPITVPTSVTGTTRMAITSAPFANTSFSESVNYNPEGRSESIAVSVELNGSVITQISSTHSMNDGKSRMYQRAFEAEIQPLVVGKDIKTLNLSRVAGASLTTDAFMQAVEGIKSKM